MKRYLFFCLLGGFGLFAYLEPPPIEGCCDLAPIETKCCREFNFKLRLGYFYRDCSCCREVYGNGMAQVGFELYAPVCRCFYWFFGVDQMHAGGRTLGGNQKTSITITPISGGLMYRIYSCKLRGYTSLALGPVWEFAKVDNRSDFLPGVYENGIGGVVRLSFDYCIGRHLQKDSLNPFIGSISTFGPFIQYIRNDIGHGNPNNSNSSIQTYKTELSGLTLGATFALTF